MIYTRHPGVQRCDIIMLYVLYNSVSRRRRRDATISGRRRVIPTNMHSRTELPSFEAANLRKTVIMILLQNTRGDSKFKGPS